MSLAISSFDEDIEGLVFVAHAHVFQNLLDSTVTVITAIVIFEPLGVIGKRFGIIRLRSVALGPIDVYLGVVEIC